MLLYMLDTNMISQLMRGHPSVVRRVAQVPMAQLCMSAVTEGELRFGLARRPEATHLQKLMSEVFRRIDVLPWDSTVTQPYSVLRAELQRQGRTLAPLDMMIAGHALAINAVLVTNDQAFAQVTPLTLEDWTIDRRNE